MDHEESSLLSLKLIKAVALKLMWAEWNKIYIFIYSSIMQINCDMHYSIAYFNNSRKPR